MLPSSKSGSADVTSEPARQYIIQLQAATSSLDDLRRKLIESGVDLDPSYGPISVNPAAGHYVVRGRATPDARKRAEKVGGISFFGDAPIRPAR